MMKSPYSRLFFCPDGRGNSTRVFTGDSTFGFIASLELSRQWNYLRRKPTHRGRIRQQQQQQQQQRGNKIEISLFFAPNPIPNVTPTLTVPRTERCG